MRWATQESTAGLIRCNRGSVTKAFVPGLFSSFEIERNKLTELARDLQMCQTIPWISRQQHRCYFSGCNWQFIRQFITRFSGLMMALTRFILPPIVSVMLCTQMLVSAFCTDCVHTFLRSEHNASQTASKCGPPDLITGYRRTKIKHKVHIKKMCSWVWVSVI